MDRIGEIEPCSSRDLFKRNPFCRDPDNLLLQLEERVERIEKNADDLYSVIEYIAKDDDVIAHFSQIEPFPMKTVKGALRHLVWKLEEEIRELEGDREEDEFGQRNPTFGWDIRQPPPTPLNTKSDNSPVQSPPPSPDSLVSPDLSSPIPEIVSSGSASETPESEAIAATNVYAYPIIRNEVDEMIHELDEWHTTNEEIINTLNQVKGMSNWSNSTNVLCECLKDVQELRNVLNTLTGGRYLKGLDIRFLNPRLVTLIEQKLKEAKKFLKKLVQLLQDLDLFLRQLRAIKIRFAPYLGKTPILDHHEEPDIGLDKLYGALVVVEDDMNFIDEIMNQLLVSSEERDEVLAYMLSDIAWCFKVKLDKEEVEDILFEKADLNELDNKISRNVFVRLVNGIAGSLYTSTGELILQEALWCSIMDDMKNKLAKKASKTSMHELEKIIATEIEGLNKRISKLKSNITPQVEKEVLKHGECVSCGIEMPFQCNEEKRIATQRTKKLNATLLSVKSEFRKNGKTVRRLLKAGPCGKFLEQRKLYKYKRPYTVDDRCKTKLRHCGGSHTLIPAGQNVIRECPETEYQFEECIDTKECLDRPGTQNRFIPIVPTTNYRKTCYGYEPTKDFKQLEKEREPPPKPIEPTQQQTKRKSKITETKRKSKIIETKRKSKSIEMKRESKIPETKRESKITEVKRESEITEAKRESEITEVKRESKITEAKRESKITEAKRESKKIEKPSSVSAKEPVKQTAKTDDEAAQVIRGLFG